MRQCGFEQDIIEFGRDVGESKLNVTSYESISRLRITTLFMRLHAIPVGYFTYGEDPLCSHSNIAVMHETKANDNSEVLHSTPHRFQQGGTSSLKPRYLLP
jgi:hypothetical protein